MNERLGFAVPQNRRTLLITCLMWGLISLIAASDALARVSVASWYGPGLEGNLTASGTVCCGGFTTAHKNLPFGTMVTLENPDDGRQVEVEVTDRGPFVGDREFDVTPAAAAAIGLTERGVMPVEVVAIT